MPMESLCSNFRNWCLAVWSVQIAISEGRKLHIWDSNHIYSSNSDDVVLGEDDKCWTGFNRILKFEKETKLFPQTVLILISWTKTDYMTYYFIATEHKEEAASLDREC